MESSNFSRSPRSDNERLTRVEVQVENLREDLRTLTHDDIREIKRDIKAMREDFVSSQRGMTRGEKITTAGVFIAAFAAVVTVVAIFVGSPGP